MFVASESGKKLARCLNRADAVGFSQISVLADEKSCETLVVPKAALHLFAGILEQMAQGNIVTLVPVHAELTTQEAADLINVSRPFLIKQLEMGKLPFRKVGRHRRIKYQDLMSYKEQIDALRNQALDELAALEQELGLEFD